MSAPNAATDVPPPTQHTAFANPRRTMNTLAQLINTHRVDVLDHLDRDVTVPILTGPQRQGDVIVIPDPTATATTPVPAAGVPVVRGENGGNTHALLAAGPGVHCDLTTADRDSLTLATVAVPEGSTAYLAHPEHGFNGIGPGTYRISRQREQADEIRLVQD